MRKLIVAVKSCQRDMERGDHDVIRETWGKTATQSGILTRFFVGASDKKNTYRSDEVALDCEDTYAALPFKTRDICRWASGKMVDYIFLCDTDTYIHIPFLLTSGFENSDYLGQTLHSPNKVFKENYQTTDVDGKKQIISPCYTWCSGGFGYFLSRKAARAVGDAFPTCWAEDMFVGQVLGPGTMVGEYIIQSTRLDYNGTIFSWHYSEGKPGEKDGANMHEWMRAEHRKPR